MHIFIVFGNYINYELVLFTFVGDEFFDIVSKY